MRSLCVHCHACWFKQFTVTVGALCARLVLVVAVERCTAAKPRVVASSCHLLSQTHLYATAATWRTMPRVLIHSPRCPTLDQTERSLVRPLFPLPSHQLAPNTKKAFFFSFFWANINRCPAHTDAHRRWAGAGIYVATRSRYTHPLYLLPSGKRAFSYRPAKSDMHSFGLGAKNRIH